MNKELQASILHTILRHPRWVRSVNLDIASIPPYPGNTEEELGDWRKPICAEDFHADYQGVFLSIMSRSKTLGADNPGGWRDVLRSNPHDQYLKFEHDILRIRIDHTMRASMQYKTAAEFNSAGIKCIYAISAFEYRANYLFLRTSGPELFQEMTKAVSALEKHINNPTKDTENNDDA